jgi:hypothetical protein
MNVMRYTEVIEVCNNPITKQTLISSDGSAIESTNLIRTPIFRICKATTISEKDEEDKN